MKVKVRALLLFRLLFLGHTGFTGTCAWVDPDNGLIYVFLSNRTYPDAWVNKLSKLEIREKIQETIYEAMKEK